jgi:hypothetical protein
MIDTIYTCLLSPDTSRYSSFSETRRFAPLATVYVTEVPGCLPHPSRGLKHIVAGRAACGVAEGHCPCVPVLGLLRLIAGAHSLPTPATWAMLSVMLTGPGPALLAPEDIARLMSSSASLLCSGCLLIFGCQSAVDFLPFFF